MKRKLKTLEQLKKEFIIKGSEDMLYLPEINWYIPQEVFPLFGKIITIKGEMKIFRGINYYEIKEHRCSFPVEWFEEYKFIDEEEFKV